MMQQSAIYVSEWSYLQSDYAALLRDSVESLEIKMDAVAHRLIESGVTYSEFEVLHAQAVRSGAGNKAARERAASVKAHILSAYDHAFREFQHLARKGPSEVMDRRKAVYRDGLRSEVSLQNRLLKERSAELEKLNANIAERRDEMAAFLYSVSHDLKSPLNTVKGLLSFFIEDHKKTGVDLTDIKAALATTCRTGVMLDDLLTFSQSLDAKAEDKTVDLDVLVQDILDDLVGDSGDLPAAFEKDDLAKVWGSSFQLRLLFQNLISNATKYCAQGVRPRVQIRNEGAWGRGHTAISVIDNGIGIDPKYHENIFGLFKRLHGYEEYPGTGIGLALCKRVVMNHKGQIYLQSEPGKGSTFTVVLPR